MSSPQQNRGLFSTQISALGARLSRAMSRDGSISASASSISGETFVDDRNVRSANGYPGTAEQENKNTASFTTMADDSARSRSRGRELYSTGRGGAGNIHRSVSGTRQGITDDIGTPARGREPPAGATTTGTGDRITHVGRGGAGNVRSPSREPRDATAEAVRANYEQHVIERHEENVGAVSTGRGGAGNILRTPENSRSRSRDTSIDQTDRSQRSQSRGRGFHSTGRGGAGNITDFGALEEEEDAERRAASNAGVHSGVHSTGRGGLANVTSLPAPPPDAHVTQHGGAYATGRGGAGNIRDRSASRDTSRSRVREDHHHHSHHGFGKILDKVLPSHEAGKAPNAPPMDAMRFSLDQK